MSRTMNPRTNNKLLTKGINLFFHNKIVTAKQSA